MPVPARAETEGLTYVPQTRFHVYYEFPGKEGQTAIGEVYYPDAHMLPVRWYAYPWAGERGKSTGHAYGSRYEAAQELIRLFKEHLSKSTKKEDSDGSPARSRTSNDSSGFSS
jgi:hypothetical protein